MKSSDTREVRTQPTATVECPKCRNSVTLVQETDEWVESTDGSWKHAEYGPGVGECGGLLFLDCLWDGIKVFRLAD